MRGLIVFSKTSLASNGIIIVSIPQSRTRVLIRAGTSDTEIFEQIFVHQQYALGTTVSPKLIVDCGANVGFASVYFANEYPEAEILAVEPEESNFEMLKANTASYPNIKVLQSGIWSKKTQLRIENPEDGKDAFRVQEAEFGETTIDALTIEDILSASKKDFIDILKLDIEGAEKEVFEHSNNWLDRVDTLIVELHDRFKPGCSGAFYKAISRHNFRVESKGQNLIGVREPGCRRPTARCESRLEERVDTSHAQS